MFRTTVLGFLALALGSPARGNAQTKADPWVGKRVYTKAGTALWVGNQVVGDAGQVNPLYPAGHDRAAVRVYKVTQAKDNWLWLVSDPPGLKGWARVDDVIAYEKAVDYYSDLIKARPTPDAYVNRGVVRDEQGDHDNAIKDFDEAIRLDPRNEAAYFNRGNACAAKKDFARALADHTKAVQIDPQYVNAQNALAWILATCPDARFRDGKKALAAATHACALTGWTDPMTVDTLAAAYAECNDFGTAATWQAKAIEWAKDDPLKADLRTRLDLYRANKPFRDVPGPAPGPTPAAGDNPLPPPPPA